MDRNVGRCTRYLRVNKDASSIEIEGKAQFVSYLGDKLKSMPEISDKVVFITGAEEVKIKNE